MAAAIHCSVVMWICRAKAARGDVAAVLAQAADDAAWPGQAKLMQSV
ncbi:MULTISPECIES: hypothetical protein [Roseobacteraceae]